MKEYHKIQTVYKRDPANHYKTLLVGEFSIPEFEYLAQNEWVFTEKVDGTNVRIIWKDGVLSIAGKTDNAQLHPNLMARLYERFPVGLLDGVFGKESAVCLYGEGYGPKIQGGGKYRSDHDFVLFDVMVGDWWLERINVEDVAIKLDVDIVPIIGSGTLQQMVDITAAGFQSRWSNFIAEGIVARPAVELFARNGNRIITKIKHKDFK